MTGMVRHGAHARLRIVATALGLAVLAACSAPPAPQKVAPRAPVPERDVLAEVRAAGAEGQDSLDVQPLRDPVITDLREAATRHESARDWKKADAALAEALMLTPDDPDLLQWRAELALVQRDYDEAVRLANASWENGPRLGALCRRNWTAIRIARELTGYPDAATAAAGQVARCTVEPPVRM